MQFTSFIAAAILAYTVTAYPANGAVTSTSTLTPPSTTSSIAASSSTSTSTSTNPSLSLTQQLFLADTAADRFSLLPSDASFKFAFANPALKGKGGKGGDLIAANRKTFPALTTTSSGMAVGFLGPCGFNTPHIHPRATELQLVISGRLITEMVPENGVFNDPKVGAASGRRVIRNEIGVMEMQPFYQGAVHAQFNPDCEPATFVASFNSEDFGAGQVVDEVVVMGDEVVKAAFGGAIDGSDLELWRKSIPVSIAKGVESCLAKCKIAKK